MTLKPPEVVERGGESADEKETLLRWPAHREIADQLTALIQHRCQSDPPDTRHMVGHHMRKPLRRPRAGHLKFAVVGNLQHPHALAHGFALGRHMLMRAR